MIPVEDIVDPPFTDTAWILPEQERYSYVYSCDAEVLDHISVGSTLEPWVAAVSVSRGNADAPEASAKKLVKQIGATRAVPKLERMRKINRWIADNVVPINFDGSLAALKVHSAASVLATKAGDSKDIANVALAMLRAAGVEASPLNKHLGNTLDRQGRVPVQADLSLPAHPEVFVAGDQASVHGPDGKPLPSVAPVAMQQGAYLARRIAALAQRRRPSEPFVYVDKGQMATIGRRSAILESGNIRIAGIAAWLAWLVIHIYYLVGFKNRLLVVLQWVWSYFTYRRGARLIVGKEWRFYSGSDSDSDSEPKLDP